MNENTPDRRAVAEARWPEHAKLEALEGKNEVVGDFIEWLKGQGVRLMVWEDDDDSGEYGSFRDDGRSTQALIAAHFGIDERTLEAEKRQMLALLRAAQDEVLARKAAEQGNG